MHQPEALLAKGERQVAIARHPINGWARRRRLRRAELRRQFGNRRFVKERAQPDRQPQLLPNARHHLRRRQRVPTQIEEVASDTDLFDAKHCLPDRRKVVFQRAARRDIGDIHQGEGGGR